MGRRFKKAMTPESDDSDDSSELDLVEWKYTTTMNMFDLSRDDDYCSYLFVEKLGRLGGGVPLLVHKMDSRRALPKTDTVDVLNILRRFIRAKGSPSVTMKQAVNELLMIPSVLYFIKDYSQSQINAFATHATRYLEVYIPGGCVEIAQTTRYSRITGKNELCILATRRIPAGHLIEELKGSMADLTDEEDRELKRTGADEGGMRRDFSVIHSKAMKKNHLFLGPARFVNHDCDNNCELERKGRIITFRATKNIEIGQELTAHYGNGYFGKNNRHCLCETCERRGKGGFAPQQEEEASAAQNNGSSDTDSDGDSDSDSDTSSVMTEISAKEEVKENPNERRTRRGVYRVIRENNDNDDDKNEDDADSEMAVAASLAADIQSEPSGSSVPPSFPADEDNTVDASDLSSILRPRRGRPPKLTSEPAAPDNTSSEKLSFRSVITTRGQKAKALSLSSSPSRSQSILRASRAPSCASTSVQSSLRASLRPRKSESEFANVTAPKPRGRPRKHQTHDVKGTPDSATGLPQKDPPSGPSCITCLSPLPINESEPARRGKVKEIKEECFRCRRHHIIYSVPWPRRNIAAASRASVASMTRENTPLDPGLEMMDVSTSKVDSKIQHARLLQLKRARDKEHEGVSEERTLKRQKSSASPSISSNRLKAHASDRTVVKVEDNDEVSLDKVPVRDNRSGPRKKDNAKGATKSTRVSIGQRGAEEKETPSAHVVPESPPYAEDGDDRRDKTFLPALPAVVQPEGIKRIGLLNLRPNPHSFSRWRASPLRSVHSSDSTPTLVDDDTDGTLSDVHPATPDNHADYVSTPEIISGTPPRSCRNSVAKDLLSVSEEDNDAEEVDSDENVCKPGKLSVCTFKGLGLISKPSPVALSKRIWAPQAQLASSDLEALTPLVPTTPKRNCTDLHAPVSPSSRSPQESGRSGRSSASIRSPRSCRVAGKKSFFLDGSEVSEGEEDAITHGNPNSKLFLLQRNAEFSPSSSRTSSPSSFDRVIPFGEYNLSVKKNTTPQKFPALEQPKMLSLGTLHSHFLTSDSVAVPSPSFVNAGWGTDSD